MNDYFKTGHLQADLKKHAVRGAGFTVLSQALSFAVHIGSTMVLARLLTPDDFGLVAMVVTFSLLLQNFGLNGFTEAIMQKEELDQATVSTLFWINTTISLGLTVLFMASSPLLASLYREPRLQAITAAIALSIIFSGLANIHMALLKRSMQFKITSAIFFAARMMGFAVAIGFALLGWGYWALVINIVAQPFVNAVCAWLFCGWRPGMPARGTGVRSMVVYAMNVYGNFSLNYGSRNVDNLLVGRSFGSLALGYYKKAYDIFALPVNQLTAPLTDVALATLSRLVGEPARYRRYYLDAVSILAFAGMAMSLVMTVGAHDLVRLILGPQWSRSADLLLFFGPGVGIMLVYYTNSWLHLSLGRAERLFRWGFIELFVTVAAFLVGLRFGPAGVAAAWTVSFYLLTGIGLWYAGKPIQIKLRSVWAEVWRYLTAAAGAGAASVFLLRYSGTPAAVLAGLPILLRIALTCTVCLSLYLLFVIALYRGIRPLSLVISLVRDMAPRRFARQRGGATDEGKGEQVQIGM